MDEKPAFEIRQFKDGQIENVIRIFANGHVEGISGAIVNRIHTLIQQARGEGYEEGLRDGHSLRH
jgi:hypothetical protein